MIGLLVLGSMATMSSGTPASSSIALCWSDLAGPDSMGGPLTPGNGLKLGLVFVGGLRVPWLLSAGGGPPAPNGDMGGIGVSSPPGNVSLTQSTAPPNIFPSWSQTAPKSGGSSHILFGLVCCGSGSPRRRGRGR